LIIFNSPQGIKLFLLCLTKIGALIPLIEVTVTSNFVGSLESEYSFTIQNLPNTIPLDGFISITFPDTFIVPHILNIIPFQGLGSKTTPSLKIERNTITILNGSPYSQNKISFLIFQGDINAQSIVPLTNQTGFLQVHTRHSNDTVIDYDNSVPINILPRIIDSLTLESLNPLTSASSSLIMNISLPFSLAQNGTVLVKFPLINTFAPIELQRSVLYRLQSCFKLSSVTHFFYSSTSFKLGSKQKAFMSNERTEFS